MLLLLDIDSMAKPVRLQILRATEIDMIAKSDSELTDRLAETESIVHDSVWL
jgi:hypothetical protein